jgi:hypothetical protein
LGNGLLQYRPNTATKKARDSFSFSIIANNQALKTDSIGIIIENDSTKLPCLFAKDDYVFGVTSSVLIDVASNDLYCNRAFSISVFQPNGNYPPRQGSAKVVNNKIEYIPNSTFANDSIIYKLSIDNDFTFGIVYLRRNGKCAPLARNDQFEFSSNVGKAALKVLANDQLCADAATSLSLFRMPKFGSVKIDSNKYVSYVFPPSAGNGFVDSLTYQLCLSGKCVSATVAVSIKSDVACALRAVEDFFDLSGNNIPLMQLDVLNNDILCGKPIDSFTIVTSPQLGTANINTINNSQFISYQRPSSSFKSDSLVYRICQGSTCGNGKVRIKLSN